MTAESPIGKEVAGAVPLAVFVASIIFIILTMEFYGEFGKGHSVGLLGIAIGFFNLTD
jgi:hypothetical protein